MPVGGQSKKLTIGLYAQAALKQRDNQLCCVLCDVCCVLRAVWRAVCCVLCAVCCVLCAVYCVCCVRGNPTTRTIQLISISISYLRGNTTNGVVCCGFCVYAVRCVLCALCSVLCAVC